MTETRDPRLIEEELADLCQYLDGVPDELRETAAFAGYRARREALRQELERAQNAATRNAAPTD